MSGGLNGVGGARLPNLIDDDFVAGVRLRQRDDVLQRWRFRQRGGIGGRGLLLAIFGTVLRVAQQVRR